MNIKNIKFIGLCLGLIAIALGTYLFIQHRKLYPSTDDAYVQNHTVNVVAQVSGVVQTVQIENQQHVKKGQLLFSLDPKPFTIALSQAKAQLKTAQQNTQVLESDIKAAKALVQQRQAQLIEAQKSHHRVVTLVQQDALSQAQKDQSISDLNVAKAALEAAQQQYTEAQQKLGERGNQNAAIQAAQAAVNKAKLDLEHTQITAPTSGTIAQFTLRPGDAVAALQSNFSIVADQHWWITANFKETQLDRIRINQPVQIQIDMYPSLTFEGHVLSISPGSGSSFSLLPPENATGNWVKVTQRVPVRISIQSQQQAPLRLGASATVTIDTTQRN
jgi:membrane fusion protein (multidrug efflux system)